MTRENDPDDGVSRRDVMKKAGLTTGALMLGSGAFASSGAAHHRDGHQTGGGGGGGSGNPHFVSGPTCSVDSDGCVTSTGSIAGLGNTNIDVEVVAQYRVTTTCTNPGGNVAPGQTKTVSASGEQSNIQVENGRANFSVTACPPTTVSGVCPNPSWTANIESVEFLGATLNVYQPAGSDNVILSQTLSC